jgi:hypothetical protein
MKKNFYIVLFVACLCLVVYSCADWLDVKPKQHTEEEDLFSREVGFKEALTGAYQLSAKSNLYGRKLTYDYIDKLAQRYRYVTNTGETPFQNPNYYDFETSDSEDQTNAIWKDLYNVIANINNLLYWIEKNKHVLVTPHYYEIIKGEALALRSYLYFDLLRMFGPVYKNNPEARSIVYRTEFNRDAKNLEKANDMIGYIIRDLTQAEELLKNADPLNFDYINKTSATSEEDPFLIFRFKRMNYLAVKALLARVYLYKGDIANAGEYASQVVKSKKFSLTRNNASDHILSGELIFGLHIDKMKENVSDRFTTNAEWIINDRDNRFFRELFNIANDGENDFRVRIGAGFEVTYTAGTTYYILKKFDQTGLQFGMLGTMPMIRLAEMYLILSECATTLEESTEWLNNVRGARGILLLQVFTDNYEKMKSIEIEYRKDFYGEGQLWYYYKRIGADGNQFFNMNNVLTTINDRNYIFTIPDDEYLFGGVSQ